MCISLENEEIFSLLFRCARHASHWRQNPERFPRNHSRVKTLKRNNCSLILLSTKPWPCMFITVLCVPTFLGRQCNVKIPQRPTRRESYGFSPIATVTWLQWAKNLKQKHATCTRARACWCSVLLGWKSGARIQLWISRAFLRQFMQI